MTGDWARQDILTWDIWQGHNLCPLQRGSSHTGSFVRLCRAESRLEISLPQPLTSASCFLFPWPPLSPSCPSLLGPLGDRPGLDCRCDVVAVRCRFKVHSPPGPGRPGSPATRPGGMSEPSRIFCSSRRLSGNKSQEQEDGRFLDHSPAACRRLTHSQRSHRYNHTCITVLASYDPVLIFKPVIC